MEILSKFLEGAMALVPTAIAIVGSVLTVIVLRYLLEKKYAAASGKRYRIQMTTLIVSLVGLLVVIIVIPVSDSLRGQLLSLIGILLSAAIALSSTTFVGNIMAGLMLRVVRSFRPGDFIRVGENFGRVSEQSLFHVEIQTEDRDLTTMPNLYLVTNPVKVIRSSGTIISAEVSLGYDISRTRVESILIKAANEIPLKDPFVLLLDLGDFSVTYRVSGLLEEVKQLLSTRSRLRELVMDKLHKDGVEIVSPTFMNMRAVPENKQFIPTLVETPPEPEAAPQKPVPEKVVFDKAEQAQTIEKLREKYERYGEEIEAAKKQVGQIESETVRAELATNVERLENRRRVVGEIIKRKELQQDD